MDELFDKFCTDRLTPQELEQLRARLDGMTDDELDQILRHCAETAPDNAPISDSRIEAIKSRIDSQIRPARPNPFYKWAAIAAAILLPILLFCTVLFYQKADRLSEYENMIAGDITLKTGQGQSVTTTLPDGSTVKLGPSSVISYTLTSFNESERTVRLNGSAYFDVTKNPRSPFRVESQSLSLRVTGTKFRITARRGSPRSEVYLDEGSVDLAARKKADHVVSLKSGQLALIDNATGSIAITEIDNPLEASAIASGTMVFKATPLEDVLRQLTSRYGRTFEIDTAFVANDPFTGYLPDDNIDEAIYILEHTYNMKGVNSGSAVRFSRRN